MKNKIKKSLLILTVLILFSCDNSNDGYNQFNRPLNNQFNKKSGTVYGCSHCRKTWVSENYPKPRQECSNPLGHSILSYGRSGQKRYTCCRCQMTVYTVGKPNSGKTDCWILDGGRSKHCF